MGMPDGVTAVSYTHLVREQVRFDLLPEKEYCGLKLPAAHYTPDFVLTYADGTVEVVEVKDVYKRQGPA